MGQELEKTLLGDWGSNLDDRFYAEAVAGLGIPGASWIGPDRIRWRSGLLAAEGSPDWADVSSLDPMVAAERWRRERLNLSLPARILDWPTLDNADQLIRTLVHANPRSLTVEPGDIDLGAQRSWRWPLRVGVLPGADLVGLADFFAKSTAPGLFRVEQLDGARETCDLLLLPRASHASLFGPYDDFHAFRARATVVMTDLEYTNVLEIRARTEADGLRRFYRASAMVGLPTKLTLEVIGTVFRELAHNRYLDEAVFDALRKLRIDRAPCILGTPDFMAESCLVSVAHRYDRVYEQGILPSAKPVVRTLRGRSSRPPAMTPGVLADQFVKENGFERESDGASSLAEETKKVESMVDSARVPRFMHARFLDQSTLAARAGSDVVPPAPVTNPPVDDDGTLLVVRVSPSLDGPHADAPVPENDLDFSVGSVALHVMVELTGASITPLPSAHAWKDVFAAKFVQQLPRERARPPRDTEEVAIAQCAIELPETGESTLATFYLIPHEGDSEIAGRISLIHRNRVLQTVKLTAGRAVVALGKTPPANGITAASIVRRSTQDALELAPEPQIRDRLDDLADARDFDATLVVADDLGPRPNMTMRRGDNTEHLSLSAASVRGPIDTIATALGMLTKRPPDQDVLPLYADRVRPTLVALATQGRLLYRALPDWLRSDDVQRIQVVTRGDVYFPVEFMYDGPAPGLKATVCANAARALAAGSCGECPNQQSGDHVCPLRFFGLSRTIERHSSPADAKPTSLERGPRPSPTRTPFGHPAPVLRGASARAYDFASSAALVGQLTSALAVLDQAAVEATTWAEWSQAAAKNPKLFVALPHSQDYGGTPVLEIGNGDPLTKAQIREAKLIAEGNEPRLVMLLGCSMAEPTLDFATYPSEFRAAGADIVVASLAPILGADSVPIASEFAHILQEVATAAKRQTLGELLALVRRRCLAAGHPGVLGIVAYGDADWVFGG